MSSQVNTKLLSMFGQSGSIFGVSLLEIMKHRNDIIVLSADMSSPAGLDKYKTLYPDNFLNTGIAEQNMIGTAAGLCNEGFKTICVAQSCFLSMRSFEQIRQYAGYMKSSLILVGISAGFSLQYMGNTHYSLEDVALMRTIPGMNVIIPSDALEAVKAFEQSLEINSAVYLKLSGLTNLPIINVSDYVFSIGKGVKLTDGADILIIANGTMVSQALKVAEELNNVCVINMHTVKPLDTEIINDNLIGKKIVVTIEEGFLNGGLGSAVADFISLQDERPKLLRLGINDFFPKPGSYPYLLQQCGLSVDQIVETIKNNI